jgi:hypothetical protein
MNGLMKNRPGDPISFAKKQERIGLGQAKENRMSHTDTHCAVYILRKAPAIGEDGC